MATLTNESAFAESEIKDVCGVASITSLILLSRSLHIRLSTKKHQNNDDKYLCCNSYCVYYFVCNGIGLKSVRFSPS